MEDKPYGWAIAFEGFEERSRILRSGKMENLVIIKFTLTQGLMGQIYCVKPDNKGLTKSY